MADVSGTIEYSFTLDDTLYGVNIPCLLRFCKEVFIDYRLVSRIPQTGRLDLRFPLPRIWAGYFYFLHENCVVSSGSLEYQNQRLAHFSNNWDAQIATIENAFNFGTADLDLDLIDETAEDALWRNPNDSRYYFLPPEIPVDKLQLSLPPGVSVEIRMWGIKYSPISYGLLNEYDIYQDLDNDGCPDFLLENPTPSTEFPSPDPSDIIDDFDAIARDRGYITGGDCPECPECPPPPNPWDGGECSGVSYRVISTVIVENALGVYVSSLVSTLTNVPGKITGIRIAEGRKTFFVLHEGGERQGLTLTSSSQFIQDVRISSVSRMDNAPDVC